MAKGAFPGLTDLELVARVAALCLDECRGTADIIRCLNEIEARQIHLNEAYPSMYEYCMDALDMSESAACRRLAAARVAKRFPCLLPAIARGELHLSSLALLRGYLTEANVEELLPLVAGKSRNEIALILAARAPKPDVPDSITPIAEQASLLLSSAVGLPPAARVTPLSAASYEVKLTISAELHEKLQRARDLMMHREPSGDLAVVIERALDALLAKIERERFGKTSRPRASSRVAKQGAISHGAKREVVARDGERCTFESESGRRCRARAFIELDHVAARALGGSGEASNVRVLCKAHNRFHAEKVFGRDHVANAIERRRQRPRARELDATEPPVPPPAVVAAPEPPAIETSASVDAATESSPPVFSSHTQILQGLRYLGFKPRDAAVALEVVLRRREQSKAPCPLPDVLRDAIGFLTPTPAVYRAGGHATFDAVLR